MEPVDEANNKPQADIEPDNDAPLENQTEEDDGEGDGEGDGDDDGEDDGEQGELPGSPCYPFVNVSTALLYTWDALDRSSKAVLQQLLDIIHRPDFMPTQCPKTVSNFDKLSHICYRLCIGVSASKIRQVIKPNRCEVLRRTHTHTHTRGWGK